ncbi:IS110 family transposase [Fodinibius halophilus]|uniref:IS110 family transposase n=1 Tax=Fodinibius halophilus TaxID=1736908 RepID=A0A6M1T2H6_9BACT|nr:IS110 family transposase [Fodinibius halophilus]NGP90288.1 IS110 family transposase [Fodinibius halophilus]
MKITLFCRFIVGIDISKQWLDLYLLDCKTRNGTPYRVPNTKEGFCQLGRWLETQQASKARTRLISEHTGRYGEHLLRWTTQHGWSHAVVKTTALKKVSGEHHRKTDKFDARQLAEYGDRFSDRLPQTEAPKPAVGQLKRLQAERRGMVDQRASLKQKLTEADLHDADMGRLTDMWRQQVKLLSEHITELEERIRRLIDTDPALSQRHQTLRTAPGMGPVLISLWLSLFAGTSELNPRKVSSRFGFAPHPYQSGSSVRGSMHSSGFGNAEVRRVLHQAALSVKTHCPHYRDYYNRKKAEGKPHLLVINNIINKLIRLYCAMWNRREQYDPNYIQKKFKQSA